MGKGKLEDILKMNVVATPPLSVFVGHEDLKHTGEEYLGYGNLRNYVYLFRISMYIYNWVIFTTVRH